MKTLSAPATTATHRLWADPVVLVQIDFTIPSAFTLRISDVYRQILGQQWLPLVADWGTLSEALNTVDLGGSPGTAEMLLLNSRAVDGTTKARLSDLIRTPVNTSGTYEWAFAKVTVTQLLSASHTTGDDIRLGVFYLEDPTEIDTQHLRVRMSDLSLILEDKMQLTRVTKAVFANADPDAVGRPIPIVVGSLKKVPALAVVAGGKSTLAAAITPTSPLANQSLAITDTSAFPDSGTIQVDDEQMTYVGKTPTSVFLTGRGTNGLGVFDHGAGASVWEVRSGPKAFRYVVGENRGNFKTKSIPAVYAGGVLQPSATVDLDDTTLVPGRSFAVINFPALPVIKRQVVLSLTDALAVADNIALVASSAQTTTQTQALHSTNTPTASSNTVPARSSFQPDVGVSCTAIAQMPAPAIPVGTDEWIVTYRVSQFAGVSTSDWSIVIQIGATVKVVDSKLISGQLFPPLGVIKTARLIGPIATPTNQVLMTLGITGRGPGTIAITIEDVQRNVSGTSTATLSATKTGSAFRQGGISLSGNSTADVVIGDVTCDVEGLKDDSAGTVSGTPNLLLENPHDVAKCVLLSCFPGVTTADLGTSWATTRARLETFGFKWAGLIEFTRFSDLRRRLSAQARSVLYLEAGKFEFKFLEDTASANVTLDYVRDIADDAPARVSRTPLTELKNSLWAYSQRDWTKTGDLADRYQRTKNVKDVSVFTDEIQENLELELIQSPSTADGLTSFHLAQKKRQRLMLDLVAWWNVIGLEQADYVAITNHPILAAYGGSNLIFRVTSKRYLLADNQPGRIGLALLEIAGNTVVGTNLPNVILTFDEFARGVTGVKTHLILFTSSLLADLSGVWFDGWGSLWFDTLGSEWFQTSAARIYESAPFDKGKTGPTPVLLTVTSAITETITWFDQFPSWFDAVPAGWWFDNVAVASGTTLIEVNRSDDNITYAGYEAYVPNQSYTFRYLKVRITITPVSATASVRLTGEVATFDVPDLFIQISELAIAAAGTQLSYATYGATFVVVPEVDVRPLGGSSGLSAVVKNKTLTGALIELRDDNNVLASGLADITVGGY